MKYKDIMCSSCYRFSQKKVISIEDDIDDPTIEIHEIECLDCAQKMYIPLRHMSKYGSFYG